MLERSGLTVPATLEHLVGLQAQTPHTWYVGLWSRLVDLDPVAVGGLLEDGQLVRLPLMRSTLHLETADDALALRPVVQRAVEAELAGAPGRDLSGVDRGALTTAVRDHLAAEGPCTLAALGRALQEEWPDVAPEPGPRPWPTSPPVPLRLRRPPAHADRRRIVGGLTASDWEGHDYRPTTMRQPSTVLVDGTVAGTWTAERSRDLVVLEVVTFRRLSSGERAAVELEGRGLLAFLHPGRTHEVRLH